jgi:hypothetical protein
VSPPPTETVERHLIGAWPLGLDLRSVRSPVAPNRLEAMQMIVIGLDVHKQSVTRSPSTRPGGRSPRR